MKKKYHTKYAVLGILHCCDASGYEIKKIIDEKVEHVWNATYSQIYPILKVLLKEKLITDNPLTQKGRPDKIVYSITEKGRVEFRSWLIENADLPSIKHELLLKLLYYDEHDTKYVIKNIKQYRNKIIERIEFYKNFYKDIKSMKLKTHSHNPIYLDIVFDYGFLYMKAEKKWCDKSLKLLRNK